MLTVETWKQDFGSVHVSGFDSFYFFLESAFKTVYESYEIYIYCNWYIGTVWVVSIILVSVWYRTSMYHSVVLHCSGAASSSGGAGSLFWRLQRVTKFWNTVTPKSIFDIFGLKKRGFFGFLKACSGQIFRTYNELGQDVQNVDIMRCLWRSKPFRIDDEYPVCSYRGPDEHAALQPALPPRELSGQRDSLEQVYPQ